MAHGEFSAEADLQTPARRYRGRSARDRQRESCCRCLLPAVQLRVSSGTCHFAIWMGKS